MLSGLPANHFDLLAGQLISDNRLLETKIRRELMCSADEARLGLVEVVKFLSLVAEDSSAMLTPSRRVDLVWHEFILFTRLYCDFCQNHFGKFIHHTPGGTQKENRDQFLATLCHYEQRFGTPPQSFWGGGDQGIASCGNCESIGV